MATVINFYSLCGKATSNTPCACIQGTRTDKELIECVVKSNSLGANFILKKITITKGEYTTSTDLIGMKHLWRDLQRNNEAFNLMSYRMQQLVANHLTGEEGIVWVPVQVIGPEEERTYYIPRFTKELDTLDEGKTEYSILKYEGKEYKSVMIPYYSSKKIQNYAMFYYPSNYWQLATGLYVNSELMLAIRKAKLTGIEFEDVRVSYD